MVDASRIPVIVGVGDLRRNPADGHREPLDLIHDATVAALNDSGHAELGTQIDSVFAIKTVSWSYDDLPGLLARADAQLYDVKSGGRNGVRVAAA